MGKFSKGTKFAVAIFKELHVLRYLDYLTHVSFFIISIWSTFSSTQIKLSTRLVTKNFINLPHSLFSTFHSHQLFSIVIALSCSRFLLSSTLLLFLTSHLSLFHEKKDRDQQHTRRREALSSERV